MTHVELDSRSATIESAPLSSLTPAAILPRLPTLSLALILLYGPLKTLSRLQDPQDRPGSRPRGAERENESPGELTSSTRPCHSDTTFSQTQRSQRPAL